MTNVLKTEKQIEILRLLVEGNSIRSTQRITGIHRDTIMRVMVRFGNACQNYLDESLVNLSLNHVELDEIWTFVGKKQGNLEGRERSNPNLGDQYLFTAICADSKLIVTHKIGKRNYQTTRAFIDDLESRMVRRPDTAGENRPQLSTDGWGSYRPAIAESFGRTARHGVIVKNYANPEVGRYAPPDLKRAERFSIQGISRLWTICTSHMERWNLTTRTFMKRFTRLALGFSKKLENLKAATALHIAHYNFCWRLREKGASGMLRLRQQWKQESSINSGRLKTCTNTSRKPRSIGSRLRSIVAWAGKYGRHR